MAFFRDIYRIFDWRGPTWRPMYQVGAQDAGEMSLKWHT